MQSPTPLSHAQNHTPSSCGTRSTAGSLSLSTCICGTQCGHGTHIRVWEKQSDFAESAYSFPSPHPKGKVRDGLGGKPAPNSGHVPLMFHLLGFSSLQIPTWLLSESSGLCTDAAFPISLPGLLVLNSIPLSQQFLWLALPSL